MSILRAQNQLMLVDLFETYMTPPTTVSREIKYGGGDGVVVSPGGERNGDASGINTYTIWVTPTYTGTESSLVFAYTYRLLSTGHSEEAHLYPWSG